MTDERFDRDLTMVLRDLAGDEAPASLRYRLRAITDAPTARRRSWLAPLLQLSAAALAVAAAAALGWTFLQGPIVGVKPTSSPEPTSSAPVPSESPTPSESPNASPTEPLPPSPNGWTGLAWSDPVVPADQDGLRIVDIVPWAGAYVAVGETGLADPERNLKGAFLTSPDGLHWTVVPTVDLVRSGEWMTHVFVLDGRLLATAEGGGVDCPPDTTCPPPDFSPELWTSDDGTSWTPVDSPSWHAAWSNAGAPMFMVAGDGGIIAVGHMGQGVGEPGQRPPPAVPVVFHSADGMTWEQADLSQGFDHAVFRDAAAFHGGFVIVGRDGEPDRGTEVVDPANPIPRGVGRPAAWVSSDGIHWTVASVDGIAIEGGELSDVEAGADGLFAIGAGSPVAGDATPSGWASADGQIWRVVGGLGADLPAIDQAPLPGSTILASDGRHIVVLDRVAPGSEAMAGWVSTDGGTWVRLPFTGSSSLPKIGQYDPQDAHGTYVTGVTVLPDRTRGLRLRQRHAGDVAGDGRHALTPLRLAS